jgi:hypothetical protein
VKLSTLQGKEQRTLITIEGEGDETSEDVEIIYRPGALTFDVVEMIQASAGTGGDTQAVAELLTTVLVKWDLEEDILDDRGQPTGQTRKLSTTMEDIRKVPLPFIGMVIEAITAEARGNPQKGATSDASSPREAQQEAPQTGTSS